MSKNKDEISVDEMMKNLKRGNDVKSRAEADPKALSEGELVTRADGSKAIKVKSRKRRSKQPKHEEKKKNTRNKIIFTCAFIIFFLAACVTVIVTLAYYNGNKFNEKLLTSIESKTGAKLDLKGLDVSLTSTKIKNIKLDWESKNSVVDYLNIETVDADYDLISFFSGDWKGPEVLSNTGEIQINLLDNPGQITFAGDEPVEFNFGKYLCKNLTAKIGQEGNWTVRDTQASYTVSEDGDKQAYLYRGVLESSVMEAHNIQSGVFNIQPDHADISLIINPKTDIVNAGSIGFTGKVGYKKGSAINLDTKFDNVKMDNWVEKKTQRFIMGNITKGEGTFKMKLGDFSTKEILTHVESDSLKLSTFEFIDTLALQMQGSYYSRRLEFNGKSTFTMNWLQNKVVFSDMDLSEADNLRVKGGFEVYNSGELKGAFQIGIPILGLSPVEVRRLSNVFKVDDGDFIWTSITIGGTIGNPEDDLAEQFGVIKGMDFGPAEDSAEDSFKRLNEALIK